MSLSGAAGTIRRWRNDANYFVRSEFQVKPDPWQEKALGRLSNPNSKQRFAFKACKGPGKTAFLAWSILWFLSCWGERGEHPKGAATSITEANLDANLWPELAKWLNRSARMDAMFKWTKSRVFARTHEATWFFAKRTWPKTSDPKRQSDTLAGLHAKYLMFVLDESGGIPDAVMATADAGLSTIGGWKKIIQAGNPTHLEGPLYRACTTERKLWDITEITGDPDDPKRSPRISKVWAREQIDKYGKDNPWVLVNVFGQFPPSSINTLLGPDEVNAALGKHIREDRYNYSQKRLGVDCARFGDDKTVLFPRQGLAAFEPVELRNQKGPAVAARIQLARANWHHEITFIDDTGGWGTTVQDSCEMSKIPFVPINFGGKADDNRYANRRAEMYFRIAKWIKRGGCLPNIPEIVGELTTPTYTHDKRGKLILQPKDQIKEVLHRSPDLADALALTFAFAESPRRSRMGYDMPEKSSHVSDWDPFDPRRG